MVIVLFICWMPLQIFRPIYYYLSTTMNATELNSVVLYIEIICGFLFYSISTTINPILYTIMSDKFREAFRKTFFLKQNSEETSKTATGKTDVESLNITSLSTKNFEE